MSFTQEARDGGYGLVAAGAVGVGLGISALPFYTLGAFALPVSREFGGSLAAVQSGFLAMMAAMLLTGWAWGIAVDRFGARIVGVVSLVALAVGFVAVSRSTPGTWVAAWALVGALGAGSSPATWTRGVAARFDRGRGAALGLTLTGSGLAGMVAPVVATRLIAEHGWRAAYLVLAATVLFVAVPLTAAAYRETPRAAAVAGDALPGLRTGQAVASWRFWLIAAVFACVSLGVAGVIGNLVVILARDYAMGMEAAALYAGLAGAAVIVGRVATGFLVDAFWAPGVAVVLLAVPAVACLVLAGHVMPNALGVGLAAVLVGLAAGAEFDLLAYFCARYFGMKRYGLIYSLQQVFLMVAAGAAPLLFAAVFDRTGSFSGALLLAAGLFALAPPFLLLLGRYPRHG